MHVRRMSTSIKRVKMIFSVIASPSRLEVLKILNTKGPMTYSELKTLAGFKAKKESGKFAYHLRKLLRQSLISQNRAERKYMLTTLGRLVLNSAKQIEEQALLESGRLFVRSSKHKLEEFNTDRITHSLVTEAGMPVELAQRVASEAESRIYKFQTAYLTAPLIRELVNSILIEEGLEEYRHKLSRLGMPVYDVIEEFQSVGQSQYGLEALLGQTASAVMSEYLLLIQLPRDVADSHLSGDIHISNAGHWSLKPDTLFVNLARSSLKSLEHQGKYPFLPTFDSVKDDDILRLTGINYLLVREAGREIYYTGMTDMLQPIESQEVKKLFTLLSYSYPQSQDRPKIIFEVDAGKDRSMEELLSGYLEYCRSTPSPSIGLAILNPRRLDKSYYSHLVNILKSNGLILFNNDSQMQRSASGSAVENFTRAGPVVLDSISINLPRLAFEAQNDAVYFRTKTALQLENAVNALKIRRRLVESNIKGGLLPSLNIFDGMVYSETPYMRVNLTGLWEALSIVEPDAGMEELGNLRRETINTVDEHLASFKDGGDSFCSTLITDESSIRFPQLDKDRFGRSKMKNFSSDRYSQGLVLSKDSMDNKSVIEDANRLLKEVKGGVQIRLVIPLHDVDSILQSSIESLDFFVSYPDIRVCKKCGYKNDGESIQCSVCGGPTYSSLTL